MSKKGRKEESAPSVWHPPRQGVRAIVTAHQKLNQTYADPPN
jgi:hypothetical protein